MGGGAHYIIWVSITLAQGEAGARWAGASQPKGQRSTMLSEAVDRHNRCQLASHASSEDATAVVGVVMLMLLG